MPVSGPPDGGGHASAGRRASISSRTVTTVGQPMSEDAERSAVEKQCIRVLDDFMAALNAYDAAAMDRCMHFPHPRIADSKVIVYQEPGGNPMDLFDRLKQADGWSYSRWNDRQVTQFNDSKAHVALSYTRLYRDVPFWNVCKDWHGMPLRFCSISPPAYTNSTNPSHLTSPMRYRLLAEKIGTTCSSMHWSQKILLRN